MRAGLLQFIQEYSNESDRACVILCASKIDYLLTQILAKFFLPSVNNQDELLDSDRALGDFSSHIHACYRLGLIDAEFARALHIFRRLRNSFAHEMSGGSFEVGPYRDRVRELAAPLACRPSFDSSKKAMFSGKTGVRRDFDMVAALLITRLEVLYDDIQQIVPLNTMSLIPPSWEM